MKLVTLSISPTIANEYATRCPEDIPEEATMGGKLVVSEETARLMLADAAYNSDTKAFKVGPDDMPLPIFNAYRALAKQIRGKLGE